MITTAFIVGALLAGQQSPPTQKLVTFNDPTLGLLFDHPATWIVQGKQKGHANSKSEKGIVVMSLPTSASPTGARLEIYHARFASTPDIWQTVQLRSNEQLHRTVDRQWQQDILGVPLLLTRISYTEKSEPITTVTGLLYTRTHEKMLFRLSGPTSDFDNVQYSFTTAMQTLRTVDGVMPVQEDPDHPLPPPKKTDPVPSAKIALVTVKKPAKVTLAPNTVKLVVSTKNLVFHYPNGWSVVASQPSSVTLKNEDLPSPLVFNFYSSLDSDSPATALLNASVEPLNLFDKVSLRVDSPAATNPSGCTYAWIWRIGTNAKGPLYMLQAYGQQGDYYFLCSYTGTSADDAMAERAVILKLFKSLSIVLKP